MLQIIIMLAFIERKKKINKKEENHFRKGRGKAKAVTLAMFHYTLL